MAVGLGGRIQQAVRGLSPAYFAIVMASGSISVGMRLEGQEWLSEALLGVCVAAYVILAALTLWRLARYRTSVAQDFANPSRAFGFFTFVAGTNVLGIRLALDGNYSATAILLVVSGACWVLLGYIVPWTAVLGRSARPVLATANGTWFVWVVASQSVAVSAAALEPVFAAARDALAVLAVLSWSVGIFLYVSVAVLVAMRMMLYELHPEDLDPPYWVAMGACAITVLAGSRIVEMANAPMVHATRGLVAGASVMFWAFATWLIPALVAAGWWRHRSNRVPLVYDSALWSLIFPLGMYAVAGIYLGQADQIPLVGQIGRVELWVAFAAWLVALVSMLMHLNRTVVRESVSSS